MNRIFLITTVYLTRYEIISVGDMEVKHIFRPGIRENVKNFVKPVKCANLLEKFSNPIIPDNRDVAHENPDKVMELGNTTDDHCVAVTLCIAETNPVVTTEGDTDGDDDGEISSWPSFQEHLSNSALLKNLSQRYDHLFNQQQSDLACLFNHDRFHEVKLISATQSPIRLVPYRLIPSKRAIMDQEVD